MPAEWFENAVGVLEAEDGLREVCWMEARQAWGLADRVELGDEALAPGHLSRQDRQDLMRGCSTSWGR